MPRSLHYARYNPERVSLLTVSLKSVFLGIVISTNLCLIVLYGSTKWIKLSWYAVFLALFHILEFVFTVMFNNAQVDDDSFILEDMEMHAMTVLAIIEYLIRVYYFQIDSWTKPTLVGLATLLVGQFCRSGAMYTASESFNHYIQRNQQDSHKLVTTGIYGYLRHPSYFGFFWWFVGLQVFLNNWIVTILGTVILGSFFKKRIVFEEIYLVQFFKQDYIKYREVTGTGIPFIR